MTIEALNSVLVVIPTLNEARNIEEVLHSLAQGLPERAQVSFVVADGGSTDDTVQRVTRIGTLQPATHLLHNPRRIQSAAINLAVQRFGRDAHVLVRCDAHARYPEGYVRRLLETLERTGADSVVVPMDSSGIGCFERAVAWVSNSRVGTGGSAHRAGQRSGFVDHGHHAAFRMASFRRAGGYDESFTHNEDAELDCRQRGLGARIYLDAGIRIGYRPRASAAGLAKQYFAYGRGRSRTVRRHPGSMRARQLALPVHVAVSVLALALFAWQPLWWPVFLAWPLLYVAVLAWASISIAWRERSACGLLSGPAAAVMHLAWGLGFWVGLASIREAAWRPNAGAPLRAGGSRVE